MTVDPSAITGSFPSGKYDIFHISLGMITVTKHKKTGIRSWWHQVVYFHLYTAIDFYCTMGSIGLIVIIVHNIFTIHGLPRIWQVTTCGWASLSVSQSVNQFANLSVCLSVCLSLSQSVSQQFYQSINKPVDNNLSQSTITSVSQSIIHVVSQSVSQSIHQSVNKSVNQ